MQSRQVFSARLVCDMAAMQHDDGRAYSRYAQLVRQSLSMILDRQSSPKQIEALISTLYAIGVILFSFRQCSPILIQKMDDHSVF